MIEKDGTYTRGSEFINIPPFKTITIEKHYNSNTGTEVRGINDDLIRLAGVSLAYRDGIFIRFSHINAVHFGTTKLKIAYRSAGYDGRIGHLLNEAFIQTKDQTYRVPKEHFLNALTNHHKIILGLTTKGERYEED